MPFGEVLELIDRGEMEDAKTITAVLRTARLIAGGEIVLPGALR